MQEAYPSTHLEVLEPLARIGFMSADSRPPPPPQKKNFQARTHVDAIKVFSTLSKNRDNI